MIFYGGGGGGGGGGGNPHLISFNNLSSKRTGREARAAAI